MYYIVLSEKWVFEVQQLSSPITTDVRDLSSSIVTKSSSIVTEMQETNLSSVTYKYGKWGQLVKEVYDDKDLVYWEPVPKLKGDPNEPGYLGLSEY